MSINEKWMISSRYKESCIKSLTENLASLRAKADITQTEIANIIGISRQTYHAVETCKRKMSWNTYLSLILFYDTNDATHSMLRDINVYPCELIKIMQGVNDKLNTN